MNVSEYTSWLKRDWAKAGFVVSIFLSVFLFVFVRKIDFVVFILLIQTPLYMLHETEEYVFPGGFGAFFNTKIFKLDTADGPLDENFIFFVNIGLVWVLLPACGLVSTIDTRVGLWIPYFTFFAGLSHIVLAIKARQLYNPGLIVSLFLNIPVGAASVVYLVDHGVLGSYFWNPFIFIGLGFNLLLPVMGVVLIRNYRRKQNNERTERHERGD